MGKLILVDGNSILNRAFYALPLLSNSSGLHTNAVFGFTTMLLRLLEEEKPSHFLVAFDAGKVTFRHAEYKEYKGGRAKMPPELAEQFPLIKELLQAFRISQFELPGYEADDIIGTLTKMADEEKMDVLVVSGDKDMLQLASEYVTIAITRKGISEVERFDPAYIKETYGLVPSQIIDLKGLMGDSSDNIPGIPGVGEKTALKLLHEYGTVEEVIAHADNLNGKMKDKVIEYADSARMSKDIATIFREVQVNTDWEKLSFPGFDGQAVASVFRKLEFKSLLDKMDLTVGIAEEDAQEDDIEFVAVEQSGVADFAARLMEAEALHVEIMGDNPHMSHVVGIAVHVPGTCYYIPFSVLQSDEALKVREWLSDEQRPKAMFDVHKAEIALSWQGIPLRGASFDIHLAAYLLDPTESSLILSGLARKYQLPRMAEDEEVFGKGAKLRIPEIGIVCNHLCRKVLLIQRLIPLLKEALNVNGMDQLYYELEQPLSLVLAAMERQGIHVNEDDLRSFGQELGNKVDGLVKQIYESAEIEFNLNSPKQLGEVLFDKLELPVIKKTKTGYSTDAEVLEKLEPYHEVVAKLLQYRSLAKLQSTYVDGLMKEIRPETRKVHTFYQQTIAATGRLSSQYPNLQNIPIRLEEGRKIRKVFVPSEPRWHMLAADYSQIELRVLAHISKDENMMAAFLNDQDIHTKTAMDVFGVEEAAVDSNMRRQAKAVNFGIVYGISDYGLSQNLNITRKEAAIFIEQYFVVFQGVRRYMDEIVKQARQNGFVTTLLQRRRYLPDIASSNFNIRSFAERTAMNSPIQGTAADIIKLAMVNVANRLTKDGLRSRMLLQVHDELVFEVPDEELELMKLLVPEVMESALALDVPLKVDVNFGSNWYDAK